MSGTKHLGKVIGIIVLSVLVFLLLINFIYPLAYYIGKVPVLGTIVSLGLLDKEVVQTTRGQQGQQIEKSVSMGNAVLTIHEAVENGENTELNCTIQWSGETETIPALDTFAVLDEHNRSMNCGATFHYDAETNMSTGTIEFPTPTAAISRMRISVLSLRLPGNTIAQGNWEIPFYLDRSISSLQK